jgi:hypothetical protein
MALNPFFLNGSPGEQRLVQDLINEQLKIYGIEVTYIPRKFVRKETVLREVTSSKFDDSFLLEAYVNTYEGYGGSGDILTKFGMSLRDEMTLIISKERFEDFITPFLDEMVDDGIEVSTRPREGDLVYFPLGGRLFEVKFVEHEQPFYQLGKTYVYELKCELFEYEDEVIDTSISEIDRKIEDQGYITSLNLIGYGSTATAQSIIGSGYIKKVYLNNDGYGYKSAPSVTVSPAPSGGTNATAVASIRRVGDAYSIDKILLSNAGIGYSETPTITISGGGGSGAAATCSIETSSYGVVRFNVTDGGVGYSTSPSVSVTGTNSTPVKIVTILGNNKNVGSILIEDSGSGYITAPAVTISNPPVITGIGTYKFNEKIIGSQSQIEARVKNWDFDTKVLKISFISSEDSNKGFYPGESIIGQSSGAIYSVGSYDTTTLSDKYSENDEIEQEADLILDFSESNPFGIY